MHVSKSEIVNTSTYIVIKKKLEYFQRYYIVGY